MKGCVDAIKDFDLADRCCDSCHEDANEYGYDLITIEIDGKAEYEVCCAVSNDYAARTTRSKDGASS